MTATLRQTTAALTAVLALASAAGLFAWCTKNDDRVQIALGRRLYAAHCASCHGAQLEGQPDWQTPRPDGRLPAPPHDATGHTWHHSDFELFNITKRGMAAIAPGHVSDMPAFTGMLSDEDIRAILAFIKSTWPTKEREYQELRNRPR